MGRTTLNSCENPSQLSINGYCAPGYESVKEAFRENINNRNEIGAAVSVIRNGETVVDLWGGYKDEARSTQWEKDTLCCVMSCSKSIASLAVLSLVDKGLIALDNPVANYWPEFAGGGKAKITIRSVLAQLAGIPVADAAPPGSLYDEGVIKKALEQQEPLWPEGSTPCYHSFSHGPLCQQIVLQTTGKTLGRYLREDLLGPLGIEFYLGMTEEEISRCADVTIAKGVPSLEKMSDKGSLLERAWRPMPKVENFFQDQRFRTFEFSSGNGHSNARNMAKIYGILARQKGVPSNELISQAVLDDAITEQWDGVEVITHRHFRYGTGFMLNNPYFKVGNCQRSFGHPGLGGATAFADPTNHIGFGYCCNRVHAIDNTGPCASALIDALYSAL